MIKNFNIWYISSLFITLVVAIPIITVFFSFFDITSEYYTLLKNTFLVNYISNSLILLSGVLLLTALFGITSAYLVSFFIFPGVNFFKWAFILSFAVPAYIYAYSLTAFFENYGTAFTILTNIFGEYEYNKYIPKFDGMMGSIISMSFSLFAYVYVLTRASFYYQSQNLIEVGKNLGFSSKESFFKIILPSARPSIIAGLSLVAMECLSDFGTVSFFSISTLTTGIYNAWISFDDLNTANQLSFILLAFILILFLIENYSRGAAKYHQPSRGLKAIPKIALSKKKSFFAIIFCTLLFFFSFIFPVSQMLYWTLKFPKYFQDIDLLSLNLNTITLVLISTTILIFFSFLTNYGNRISKSKFLNYLSTFSISGYAIPGVILAVALITFFAELSNLFSHLGFSSFKSLFIGSIFGLSIAYFVRFFSLSFNGIKSGYLKINHSIDESAYLLGYSKFKTFSKIHLPYLKNSIFLVGVLITIEIIKELPITLILRPFNFETFATKAYAYASQDLLEAAALPSLFLIGWASIFILISSKYILSEK
jgi:iron(III) transport system permease protein